MKKNLLVYSLFIGGISLLNAQEVERQVVASSGNHLENQDLKIFYTIGEPVIASEVNNEMVHLTQGFHQSTVNLLMIKDFSKEINIKIYPNPTTDIVHIQTPAFDGLNYQIVDLKGSVIKKGKLTQQTNSLSLGTYANGNYLFVISRKRKHLKTYQIIKN